VHRLARASVVAQLPSLGSVAVALRRLVGRSIFVEVRFGPLVCRGTGVCLSVSRSVRFCPLICRETCR
jgi:hypothetical protein